MTTNDNALVTKSIKTTRLVTKLRHITWTTLTLAIDRVFGKRYACFMVQSCADVITSSTNYTLMIQRDEAICLRPELGSRSPTKSHIMNRTAADDRIMAKFGELHINDTMSSGPLSWAQALCNKSHAWAQALRPDKITCFLWLLQ